MPATLRVLIVIKKCVQLLLGLNGACVVRGFRLGLREFVDACFASLGAAHPLQDRTQSRLRRELRGIPEVDLEEILGSRKAGIRLGVQRYEDGMLPTHEAVALLSILVAERPAEVLEIGTFMGLTTRAMAENLEDAVIHTIDLPLDFSEHQDAKGGPAKDDYHLITRRVVGREFKGREIERRIRQHFGDTAKMDFRECGKPAFFFIDGSHTYDYCKLDSEKCLALCGGVGTFLWHDCDVGHPGVLKFVSEWRAMGRPLVRIRGTSLAYWRSALPGSETVSR